MYYLCTVWVQSNIKFLRKKKFDHFPTWSYDKTLSCCGRHLGILINNKKLSRGPDEEHSYRGTIPRHMQFRKKK